MENIGIRPINDKIIVKRIEERKSSGGIVIPETSDNKSQRGTVIAIGKKITKDGKEIKISVKLNDAIIFNKYAGVEFNFKGNEYIVLKEDDIIAIIE